MEHRTRSPKGAATAALDDLVGMVFGAVPAGETACRGKGEPPVPAKIKQLGHEAGERKPMEHRTRSQKGAATAALDDLVSMVFGVVPARRTACRGRGEPSHPAKSNDPATRPEREETDETPSQKPKRGCGRLVRLVFGTVPAGETACRGKGEPSVPAKIKRPGHEAGERGNR